MLENWSPRRGGRLREVVVTKGSTVFVFMIAPNSANSLSVLCLSLVAKIDYPKLPELLYTGSYNWEHREW